MTHSTVFTSKAHKDFNNNATAGIVIGESKSWECKASLALDFSFDTLGTKLRRTRRNGPLSVKKAFYPEGKDCAHIYLLHPPAGIVSGDELHVELNLDDHAHTLITSHGANRFYRAQEDAN